MTITDLYRWAIAHHCQNYNITIVARVMDYATGNIQDEMEDPDPEQWINRNTHEVAL